MGGAAFEVAHVSLQLRRPVQDERGLRTRRNLQCGDYLLLGAGGAAGKTLLGLACLLLTACTPPRAPVVNAGDDALTATPTLAIRAVTVVDVMDGSLLPEQTVLIAGNRIGTVGATHEVRIPDDVELVEAEGRYLIPGLWDMHVHSVRPVAADASNGSIPPQDWHLPLFLAYGVTGVRNMNDDTGDVTLELTNTIKRELAAGRRHGPPRFLSAGAAIDGDPYMGITKKVSVRTAEEARAAVRQLASHGADLIKVYENVPREAYFAILDEAKRRKIPVDGHIPFRITPEEAAAAGQRTVEHPEALAAGCSTGADAERKRFADELAGYDGQSASAELLLMQVRHYRALYDTRDAAACASAFEAYRRNGVAVTVDLLVYHNVANAEQILSDTERMRLVPEAIRRNWEGLLESDMARELESLVRPLPALELQNVRLAHEAGVVLLAATDVDIPLGIPGLSLHEELGRLVEAGLTPLEALQAATRNPAQVLGLADSLGSVEAGKLADLVLLDANPLENIRNTRKIRAVVADGRLYRRADRDRLLAGGDSNAQSTTEPAVDLTQIGHVTPKGRIQDKQYNPDLPVVEALIEAGPAAIPFLLRQLENETVIERPVFDFWPAVRVGDVALTILCDFFTTSDWKASTIPGMGWDDLLERSKEDTAGWDVLESFLARQGRRGLRLKVEGILEPYDGKLRWDPTERCFKPVELE